MWERLPTHPHGEWAGRGRAGWVALRGVRGQDGAAPCCHRPRGAGLELQAVAGLQGSSRTTGLLSSCRAGDRGLGRRKSPPRQAQAVDRTLGRFHALLQPFLPSLKTHHGRQDGCLIYSQLRVSLSAHPQHTHFRTHTHRSRPGFENVTYSLFSCGRGDDVLTRWKGVLGAEQRRAGRTGGPAHPPQPSECTGSVSLQEPQRRERLPHKEAQRQFTPRTRGGRGLETRLR